MSTQLLTAVRLSYPNLFHAKQFKPDQEARFGANFILDKTEDVAQIVLCRQVMTKVAQEKWGNNIPKGIKLCLRDGAEPGREETDGYGPGVQFISASSRKAFPVVDVNKAPLAEASGKPYAGCYVNVLVRYWAQDNQYGKRINCNIQAVQFMLDGEPFGEAPVNVNEVFTDLSGGGEGAPVDGGDGGGLLG